MSKSLSTPHLLTLALLFNSLSIKGSPAPANTTAAAAAAATAELLPFGPVVYRAMDADASGPPFQMCLNCRCCAAADPNDCSVMPCCFGIDCDLPDKPYGVCAFVPTACNCTSCT